MIDPPPARRSAGTPYLQPRKTPLAFTFLVTSHTSSSVATASLSAASMTPALLKSTSSFPKVDSACATIASQSAALETSAVKAVARPPSAPTISAVSTAASPFRSTATTAAPSRPKSSAVSRPIPLPAPVINTALSFRRTSDPFEVASPFPVRDGAVERGLLGAEEVGVVRDDLVAERLLGERARLEQLCRLAQGPRHMRQLRRRVHVAHERLGRLGPRCDAVEPACQQCRQREVRVAVRAGDAALDAGVLALAHHPEPGGSVVAAPGDAGGRPRAVDVALVGVDRRREQRHHVGDMSETAADEPAQLVRGLAVAPRRERVLRVAPEAQVHVARRAGAVGLLLQALLVDRVAVGHLEDRCVPDVQLVLAAPPLALRALDRYARTVEVAAHGGVEVLGAGALQQLVVLEVPARRFRVGEATAGRVAVRGAEQVVLELGARHR